MKTPEQTIAEQTATIERLTNELAEAKKPKPAEAAPAVASAVAEAAGAVEVAAEVVSAAGQPAAKPAAPALGKAAEPVVTPPSNQDVTTVLNEVKEQVKKMEGAITKLHLENHTRNAEASPVVTGAASPAPGGKKETVKAEGLQLTVNSFSDELKDSRFAPKLAEPAGAENK